MPAVTAPEGYQLYDAVLTADDLLGATIYDATGDSIGSVSDLVLNLGGMGHGVGATGTGPGTGLGTGAAGGAPTHDVGGGNVAGTTMGTGTAPASDQAMQGATATGQPGAGETSVMPSGEAGSAVEGGTGMAGDTGAAAPGAAETGSAATGMAADTGTVPPATTGTGTDQTAGSTMAPGTSAGVGAAGSQTGSQTGTEGEITHAILDIGGFLGIGVHTVAVPINDLQVYRSENDTRIYLSWTRDQLEAMPEYDADNPASLGTSLRGTY